MKNLMKFSKVMLLFALLFSCKKSVESVTPSAITTNCQLTSFTDDTSATAYFYDTNGIVTSEVTTTGSTQLVAQFTYNSAGKLSQITLKNNKQLYLTEDVITYTNGLPSQINSTYSNGIVYINKLEWNNGFLSKVSTTSASDKNTYEQNTDVDGVGNMIKVTYKTNGVITQYNTYVRDLKIKQLPPKGLDFTYGFNSSNDEFIPKSGNRVLSSKGYSVDATGKETPMFDDVFTNTANAGSYITSFSNLDKVSNLQTKGTFTYSGCN